MSKSIKQRSDRTVWVVPSTHIDLGWKKGTAEMAELLESFVLRLLDLLQQHPDFCYVLEQAAHYRRLATTRPDLVALLKKAIAEGRLEVVGGMASTLETNMTNGESFVRNLELGLGWFKQHLGADVHTAWLVDTFGINAQIPQILAQFGFSTLMANRFGGTVAPDLFWARGLDGSQVLVMGQDALNESAQANRLYFKYLSTWTEIDALFQAANESNQAGDIVLMPYTENEGLPSSRIPQLVEHYRSHHGAAFRFGRLSEILPRLAAAGAELPVLSADLNPEFTATYSQRPTIRLRNRRTETLLLETELWAGLAKIPARIETDELWWIMAVNQFHDLFTGSHPSAVFAEVLANFDRIDARATELRNRAVKAVLSAGAEDQEEELVLPSKEGEVAHSYAVFNSLSFQRTEVIHIPCDGESGTPLRVLINEAEIAFEWTQGEIVILADLPPVGYTTVSVYTDGRPTGIRTQAPAQSTPEIEVRTGPNPTIADGNIELVFIAATSEVALSVLDGAHKRELMRGSLLVVQEDSGGFQIENPLGDGIPATAGSVKASLSTEHSHGPTLDVAGVFPPLPWMDGKASALEWHARFFIPRGSDRVEVSLVLKWHGERARVRLILPTSVVTPHATFEVPFGTVQRGSYAPHGSARGEWPAQRFVVVEGAKGGLALINRGTSGHELSGSTLFCSLLRAAATDYAGMYPDDTSSQHGEHHFNFCLVPYTGTWQANLVHQKALAFNSPPLIVPRDNPVGPRLHTSKLSLESDTGTVALSSVREARTRLGTRICVYETSGKPAQATLRFAGMKSAWLCNLAEESVAEHSVQDEVCCIALQPFEIVTILIS